MIQRLRRLRQSAGLGLAMLALAAAMLAPAGDPALAAGCLPIAGREPLPGIRLASLNAGASDALAPNSLALNTLAISPAIVGPGIAPVLTQAAIAMPEPGTIRIGFLGHSSFLIETAGGVSAVTDYNGYMVPPYTPTIVTMNNAHGSHYTDLPDPGIGHVLRGWNPEGGWAQHDVREGDLRVRNIPTAVHGRIGAQELSNSMFIFETPELCVAHLGHLHHVPTAEQVAELGQIDVLLVPIDGAYTMAQELMLQTMDLIAPSVVIPMHYFGDAVLGRFVEVVTGRWEVVFSPSPVVTLSRAELPHRQVLVLPGV